jgi:hypothetical protein
MTGLGHQERFPPPRLSGRCGFESDPLLPTISAQHRTVGKRDAADYGTLQGAHAQADGSAPGKGDHIHDDRCSDRD